MGVPSVQEWLELGENLNVRKNGAWSWTISIAMDKSGIFETDIHVKLYSIYFLLNDTRCHIHIYCHIAQLGNHWYPSKCDTGLVSATGGHHNTFLEYSQLPALVFTNKLTPFPAQSHLCYFRLRSKEIKGFRVITPITQCRDVYKMSRSKAVDLGNCFIGTGLVSAWWLVVLPALRLQILRHSKTGMNKEANRWKLNEK